MNQATNIFLETHEAYLAMLITQRPEWTPCSSVNGFTAVDQLYKRMLPPGHGQSFDDPPTSTSPLLCVVDGKADGDDAPLVTLSYASTVEQQDAFANTKVFAWESPLAAGGVRCMSLEDVARVLISPNLIAEMADRIGGVDMPWTKPLAVLAPSFSEQVHECTQEVAVNARIPTEMDINDCYARFVDWMLKLPLPTVRGALTWRNAFGAHSATDAVRKMSAVDFYACQNRLYTHASRLVLGAASMFVRFYAGRVDALKTNAPLRQLLENTLKETADRYMRFRYITVLLLEEARTAVMSYLTCRERIVYSGVVPEHKLRMPRGEGKKDLTVSVGVRHTRNDHIAMSGGLAPTTAETYSHVFTVANSIVDTPLFREAIPWVVDGLLPQGVKTAAAAVAVCFLWRWLSLVHCLPAILDRQGLSRTAMVTSLSPFLDKDTPSDFWRHEAPTVRQMLTAYLQTTLQPKATEVSPLAPYVAQDSAAVPMFISRGITDSGMPLRTRDHMRQYRRRHAAVMRRVKKHDDRDNERKSKAARFSIKGESRDWGLKWQPFTISLPKTYKTTQKMATVPETVTAIVIPMEVAGPARMPPAVSPGPVAYTRVDASRGNVKHLASLLKEHSVIRTDDKRADATSVRITQFVGLVAYYANHCQAAMPGIVMPKRIYEDLPRALAKEQKLATVGRKRVVRLKTQSPLAPLAKELNNRKRGADKMLFDHETTVLHH